MLSGCFIRPKRIPWAASGSMRDMRKTGMLLALVLLFGTAIPTRAALFLWPATEMAAPTTVV